MDTSIRAEARKNSTARRTGSTRLDKDKTYPTRRRTGHPLKRRTESIQQGGGQEVSSKEDRMYPLRRPESIQLEGGQEVLNKEDHMYP